MEAKNPSPEAVPPELKERAVRRVQEFRREDLGDKAVISRVARQLGIGLACAPHLGQTRPTWTRGIGAS